MVNGLPAFFGRKARSRVPVGIDITSITDISGSMGGYARFITSELLYEALETALQAEGIGVDAGTTNRYSFCVGADSEGQGLGSIERNVFVAGVGSTRWVLGSQVLAQQVEYPLYNVGGGGNENMAHATNLISENNRDYIEANERIVISGSDEQSGQGSTVFNPTPPIPHRYVGVHSARITLQNFNDPDGFVYTTASEGVAIFKSGNVLSYEFNVPVANVIASAIPGTKQINVDQCRLTNGALFNIRAFTSAADYALLGEALGLVLGRYLYSTS
jgi:hypothetical protein